MDEIKALFNSDKVRLTDEASVFLARVSNVPGLGGLRLCAQIVRVAAAGGDGGGEPIAAKLLLQVIRAIYGREYAQRAVERPVERSTLRIA